VGHRQLGVERHRLGVLSYLCPPFSPFLITRRIRFSSRSIRDFFIFPKLADEKSNRKPRNNHHDEQDNLHPIPQASSLFAAGTAAASSSSVWI